MRRPKNCQWDPIRLQYAHRSISERPVNLLFDYYGEIPAPGCCENYLLCAGHRLQYGPPCSMQLGLCTPQPNIPFFVTSIKMPIVTLIPFALSSLFLRAHYKVDLSDRDFAFSTSSLMSSFSAIQFLPSQFTASPPNSGLKFRL